MNALKISLLGVPEVHYQGSPLKFRSRRALALLAYLAAEPGWHSREKLIDLLWWEKDTIQGRTSLRGILTQLRNALQVAGAYVMAESDLVAFDKEQPYQLDLELVAAALASGAGVEAWETAVSQARGEFLEGFNLSGAPEFDDWVSIQREHWHKRLETLYEQLALHALDGGERTKAVSMASRWVAHAPFSDRACRSLMQAYLLVGDRVAALQTYDNFERVLEQELGILPEPETAALAENIQQNKLGLDDRVHSLQEASANQTLASPFVGREDEHRALVAAYTTAVANGVQAVLITGEPGIGKTYLVDTFLEWVQSQARGMDLLRGRAFEMGGRLPYQLLVDALRVRLDQENAPEDLLDDVWLAELSQLFPELRSRYPDLPPAIIGDPDLMRARLFEAVTLLVAALATRQPLLLFLDDMQWADAGALDMLKYAIHRWSEMGSPLLLILTMRYYALLTTPALQEWLEHLGRDAPLRRLDLAPLNAADVRQYLRLLAGHDVLATTSEEDALQTFGDWLFEKSGGQPFYLSEMVHMLWEQALLDTRKENGQIAVNFAATWRQLQANTQTLVPTSIRNVILARMRGLSEEAVNLLMAAAALGRKSRDETLYQVANLSEETGLSALTELLNAGLIVEISENMRPYNISHDTIREVAYTEAGEARRRIFHRRALDVLAQAPAPAAELAHHAQAAHLYESAFHYWLQAGDHALNNYSAADALNFYESARQLSETLNVSDDNLILLFEQRMKALELAGRYEDALAASRKMQTLAKERHSEMIELAAIMAQAVLFIRRTELTDAEQAQRTISGAIALSHHLGDKAAEAKALWCRQQLGLVRTGDFRQAQKDGEAALAIAQELELAELSAYILNDLSRVYTAQLNFPKATEANEATFQSWQALDNRSMLTDNLNYAAEILRKRGKLVAAVEKATEALSIASSIHNRWNIAAAYNRLGRSHFELGHINESIVASTSGISASESEKIFYYYLEQILLANRYALLGHISRATVLLEDLEYVEDTYSRVILTVTRAYLRFLQGDLASATDLISEVPFDKLKLAYFYAPLYACEIAQASEQDERALSTCNQYIGMMEQGGHFLGLPNFYYQRSVILLAQEQVDDAVYTLRQALNLAKSQRARMILWRIASRLSEIERTQGNVASANDLHNTALGTLEYVINHIDDSELRASFTALPDVKRVRD